MAGVTGLADLPDRWSAERRLAAVLVAAGATGLTLDHVVDALFRLDLDLTPRAVADVVDPVGHVPPTVTVASLFERAATAVDRGQLPAALALLDVVADETDVGPLLSAYRATAVVLAHLGRASAGSASAAELESELRTRVYDLLVRVGAAAQPTGKEQF